MNEIRPQFVTAIVPAFNEAATIGPILDTLIACPLVAEIIVVDDGSQDQTADIARAKGLLVIKHSQNQGKAEAMKTGINATTNNIFLFVDADITGLTNRHLERIISPVLKGRYDMYIGIRRRRVYWLNRILHILPLIAGERVITRTLWESVPEKYKKGFQIEIALNYFAKINHHRMSRTLLAGIRHLTKEKKRGFCRGFLARWQMNSQIVFISLRLYVFDRLIRLLSSKEKRQ